MGGSGRPAGVCGRRLAASECQWPPTNSNRRQSMQDDRRPPPTPTPTAAAANRRLTKPGCRQPPRPPPERRLDPDQVAPEEGPGRAAAGLRARAGQKPQSSWKGSSTREDPGRGAVSSAVHVAHGRTSPPEARA